MPVLGLSSISGKAVCTRVTVSRPVTVSARQEVVMMACRKNAKRDKVRRNFNAARAFIKKAKLTRGGPDESDKEDLTNYVSPFKFSPEEASAAASKLGSADKK